ncbi:MAG: hypothetical protein GYA33_12285, partial [Thermogutta sp.]|nr:hypothetical protein [Thermogutta sp.]
MLPFRKHHDRRGTTKGTIAMFGSSRVGWTKRGLTFACLTVAAVGGVVLSDLSASPGEAADGPAVVRRLFRDQGQGENLLEPDAWRPYGEGYAQGDGGVFICDNGTATVQRGAVQTLELNQTRPTPIAAFAESAADNVGGGKDSNYSLYLDLVYQDGTPLWGQSSAFSTGSHDWERAKVLVFPDKPIKRVSLYLLFRGHSGRASFRHARLHELKTEGPVVRFDGVPCLRPDRPHDGFSVRDVAADSDFVAIDRAALGLELDVCRSEPAEASRKSPERTAFYEVKLKDTTGRDRAVTLVFSLSDAWVRADNQGPVMWCGAPDVTEGTAPDGEYMIVSPTRAGTGRGLSRWPLAAIAGGRCGVAIGIDMSYPAVYRCGYSAGTGELFAAFDLGLTKEKPEATLRLVSFTFDAEWAFRAAWEEYQRLFPESFVRRLSRHGLWMPFAKISEVRDWQD